VIFPDATLGVLGGGQLGRMFTIAAHSMGYQVWVLDPDPHSPAGSMADQHICAAYTDQYALDKLAENCSAITTEFENVPAESLQFLEAKTRVRPSAANVAIARDRIVEKTFIRDNGLATAPFFAIHEAADLKDACKNLSMPALLKTARLGYDGKGQVAVSDIETAQQGFEQLKQTACVLEERVNLKLELSVILARNDQGQCEFYPPGENVHQNGILHTTTVPASAPKSRTDEAVNMAEKLANALNYCGVLAVEFFLTQDDELLINEMAPRPHNSGHFTLDACLTDQFEQQVRMLCGLSPGSPKLHSPVVMVNLLGDLWPQDQIPDWDTVYQHASTKLHLYGKKQPRIGRKMGHYNCLADSTTEAGVIALSIFERLSANQE
jgi:5-(carboxyamino)imidazole ribonucleotide synthase